MKRTFLSILVIALMTMPALAQSNPVVGSWNLIAADKILPDGKQVSDYGSAPHGIAIFTGDGHYVVEIFRADRMKFASGDRTKGTPEEYKEALLSASCHFGTYAADVAKGTLTFYIDRSNFPNSDKTTRVNNFTLQSDTLAWRLPARPDGAIPVSIFTRMQ